MYNILYLGNQQENSKVVSNLREVLYPAKLYFYPNQPPAITYLKRLLKGYKGGIDLVIGASSCTKLALEVANEIKTPCVLLDPYIDYNVFKSEDDEESNPEYALFAIFTNTKARKDIWSTPSNKVKKYIKPSNIAYARTKTQMIQLVTKVYENYLVKHLPEEDAFK